MFLWTFGKLQESVAALEEREKRKRLYFWLCFYDTIEDLQGWVFKVARLVPLAGQELTIGRFITFLTFNRTWFQNASPAKKLSTLVNFVVLHWVLSLKYRTKRFRKILLKNSTVYVIGPCQILTTMINCSCYHIMIVRTKGNQLSAVGSCIP